MTIVVLFDGTNTVVNLLASVEDSKETVSNTNIAANSTESSAYTEGIRQALTLAAPSGGVANNTASLASFSINGTVTIYGAFAKSTNVISDTAGTLFSASKFGTSRDLLSGDTFNVGYTATFTDA